MEIKLNKDLQKMQDNLVLGLNLRQTVCAAAGIVLGVSAYFLCRKFGLNTEIASWVCAALAAPFAALGFVTFNGMTFERIVTAWVKQFLLCPKHLVSKLENYDYALNQPKIAAAQEKEARRCD